VLLRAHVGRIDDQRWASLDDQELIDRVGRQLRVLLGDFATPLDAMVQRWPDGLPQYLVGHDRLVASAKAAGTRLRVTLAGSAYDGVGVPACIGSGRRAAREALAFLST
jgi:oxygen-dependent protoporphyrinogen oxidase